MTAAADIIADAPQPVALADDGAERGLARLDRLCDLGLEIAEALAAQAKGTGPRVVEGDLALAYDRVARAVRMAVMLQSRLREAVRRSRQEAAAAVAAAGAAADPAGEANARKDQVARIVKRVAQAHQGLEPFQVSWLAREARERLEHDDIYGRVMTQPVSDLVADICHDLGLTPDWARLAEEAWARDEIMSGEAGEALSVLAFGLEGGDDDPPDREGPGDGFGEAPDEEPADPVPIAPTLHEHLQALARDPAVLAAAGRGPPVRC